MAYPPRVRRTLMRLVTRRTRARRGHLALLSATLWGILLMNGPASAATSRLHPPVAEKHPHAFALHGDSITDNYAWLREKTDPKVIAYLEAENAYTDSLTGDQAPLRKQL